MMRNLSTPTHDDLGLTSKQVADLEGATWTRGKSFKRAFRLNVLFMQHHRCAYCLCFIGKKYRNSPDIEHFADKSTYPSWSFSLENLLLACRECNQTYKRKYDAIIKHNKIYNKCYFSIIHPYFNIISNHLAGGFFDDSISPSIPTPKTLRGLRTIRLFELNTVEKLSLWQKDYDDIQRINSFTKEQNESFARARIEAGRYRECG